jgi:hypothetical protein
MDASLGITGYTIDTFESTPLIPGLSITYSGHVPTTTVTSLANLLDVGPCSPLSAGPWDGTHVATNVVSNTFPVCTAAPADAATLTTFSYAPGTTSLGIGLANFQSLSSPAFPVTNHELFINGVDMGVLEALAGAAWTPGISLNSYLRIDATSGTITSVGFENLDISSTEDFLVFDHLAVAPSSTVPTPEPTSIALLGSGLLLAARKIRSRKSTPR